MKSNAPWSVKGIAKDTRETAKEAARKEGMTVGEWLNTIIHQAGQGEHLSSGEISGVEAKDLVTAIDHLNNKISQQGEKDGQNYNQLTRNLGGLIERIQRLERGGVNNSGSDGNNVSPLLEERLEKLEAKTSDNHRIDALRALEKAVGQVAHQFDNAQKNSAADLKTVTERLALMEANHKITADTDFAERTGKRLRVLGDEIKRSGDQISSLETLIGRLADQIDAAEQRSSDGVQKVSEALSALSEKVASSPQSQKAGQIDTDFISREITAAVTQANQSTNERVTELTNSLEHQASQLNALQSTQSEPLSLKSRTDDEAVAHTHTDAPSVKSESELASILGLDDEDNNREQDASFDTEPTSAFDTATRHQTPETNTEDFPIDSSGDASGDFSEDVFEDIADDFSGAETASAETEPHDSSAGATQAPASATGSLYEDEQDEVLVEGGFDKAFDDFSLNEEFEDFDSPSVGDLDDDELSVTDNRAEPADNTPQKNPDTHPDVEVDLDGESDIFDSQQISAEINEILNDKNPYETEQASAAQNSQEASLKTSALLEESFDEFAAPDETIVSPSVRATAHQNDVQSQNLNTVPSHGSFETLDLDDPFSTHDAKQDPTHSSGSELSRQQENASNPEVADATPQKTVKKSMGKLPRTPEGKIDVARLTPKQKAILSARAQKKRREAAALQQAANSGEASHEDNYQSFDERHGVREERTSLASRVRNVFQRKAKTEHRNDVRSKIHGDMDDTVQPVKKKALLKRQKEALAQTADAAPDNSSVFTQDTARDETGNLLLKNGKPTLPLWGIIGFIAIAFAALVLKPLFDKPKSAPEPRPIAERPSPLETPAPETATASSSSVLLESPSVQDDTVRPRQLFLESMATLESSPGDLGEQAAFENIEQAAALGYPPAQFQLGEFYKNGIYTEQNSGRARTWFQRAATGGNVFAMHRLGYLYAEGEGGNADLNTAIEFFERAANFGFVDSQYNLGAIFDPGPNNTPTGIQDAGKAYKWYAIAALNGDKQAGSKASDVAINLSGARKTILDQEIATWRANPVSASANENLSY